MKLRPVEEKLRPVYPTLREFLTREEMAGDRFEGTARSEGRSHWGKGLAGAAVVCLAFNVGGCDNSPAPSGDATAGQEVRQGVETQIRGKTVVAPIFDHGVGQETGGCIVMTPPSFLSEEVAMRLIKDELAKHGVRLSKGETLKDIIVQIPRRKQYGDEEGSPGLTDPRPLAVDGIDTNRHIAVVFVSESDCDDFEGYCSGIGTVYVNHIKELASKLAASTRDKGSQKRYVGFFYDPIAKSRDSKKPEKRLTFEEERRRSLKECKELLRQQVRDFAVWLEQQATDEPQTPPKSS